MQCPICQKEVPKLSNGRCRSCVAKSAGCANKRYQVASCYEEAREKAKKYWAYLN